MTTPLRFGLIGTGRIGQVHAANIAADPEATLAWVCDPFVEGAEAVSARHGGTVTTDAAAMFASGEIDAVLIASPTATHVDLLGAALDAGVPALCEKPIDLDAVMTALDRLDYDGWIVVEQDVLNAPDADLSAFRTERGADQLVNRDALREWA